MSLQDCATGACSIDAPLVSDEEKKTLQPEIPEWQVVEIDTIERLVRRYNFQDFVTAMQFANLVGDLAEEYGHHPAILVEWGSVEVSWWSHKIKGLHKNDYILAAKTDALFDVSS